MSPLVENLERTGYVERVADPEDGRAARIRLTARGTAFARSGRTFARRIETELEDRLGLRCVEDLRAALQLIHESYGR